MVWEAEVGRDWIGIQHVLVRACYLYVRICQHLRKEVVPQILVEEVLLGEKALGEVWVLALVQPSQQIF